MQKIIEQYENLVYCIALSKRKPKIFRDLIQEGFMALCRAYKEYHSGDKVPSRFIYYARKSINNAMDKHIMNNNSVIYTPTSAYKKKNSQKDKDNLKAVLDVVSLNNHNWVADDTQVSDMEEESELKYLAHCVDSLPERTRDIIIKVMGLNHTKKVKISKIAKEYHLSYTRVYQIYRKGIIELGNIMER